MIQNLRLALAQINPMVGNIPHNVARMLAHIEEARRQEANLIVFPELAIAGYPPEDLVLREDFATANAKGLQKVAAGCRELVAITGFVERKNRRVYNAAAICCGGRVAATYHKMCLPNYGVFDEKRYFRPGEKPLVLNWNDLKIGVNICEDIWTPEPISEFQAAVGGAHVIVNISASPYHARKGLEREELVAKIAQRSRTFFVYVNMVGGQDELVFDGQTLIFDPDGKLLLRSAPFAERLIFADISIPLRRAPVEFEAGDRYLLEAANLSAPISVPQDFGRAAAITPRQNDLEEIFSALVLGTRDYVLKNGFKDVVVGLSGGIDSALTAVIAVQALGAENVHGVLMPSPFTAGISNQDAEELARNLGIHAITLPIHAPFAAFKEVLAEAFAGRAEDITEENLQSRVRGNLLMALSNKFGWLVLTTGNKSEIAVGYCTLYGDMAGGFAVLKDVPKTMVYGLSQWINQTSEHGPVIPERTIARPPTAELRENQTDQETLPPYEILDQIIEEYVENDRSFAEIVAGGLPEEVVAKTIHMIDRAEYKRRQAAPGVKIRMRNFGKERRMPMTNGFKPDALRQSEN
jgi:NAD+ synthase (glutamine-hydrolysing)